MNAAGSTTTVPDGLVVVVKRDCPTCTLVVPVLQDLAARGALHVYSQDDPAFPDGVAATASLFAAVLLRRSTPVPVEDVRSVLTAYVSQGFLTGRSGVSASADAVVVLTGSLSTTDRR